MGRNKPSKKTKRNRTDREKLELFVSKVNELRQTRLSKKGFRIYHNLHYQRGQTLQSNLEQPEEADLKEYLLTFRHFISEDEDTYLRRILNVFYVRSTDEKAKQNIAQARELCKKVEVDNSMPFYRNNERYTPLQITDMYLNGKYFHNDLGPQQLLDSLDPVVANTLRAYFLNFVIDMSKIIIIVSNNIEYGFKENSFHFEK